MTIGVAPGLGDQRTVLFVQPSSQGSGFRIRWWPIQSLPDSLNLEIPSESGVALGHGEVDGSGVGLAKGGQRSAEGNQRRETKLEVPTPAENIG
jgi:hypothetical protein